MMKDGKPTGVYEDFLVGFVQPTAACGAGPSASPWRKDGALLVTDDESGSIWRASWRGL